MRIKRKLWAAWVALFVFLPQAAAGGDVKVDPDQKYLLLATKKTGTMQKELKQAADLGFKVLYSSPTSGTEIVLLLERAASPEDPYQYILLATTRTGTMQKELDDASDKGFRMVEGTLTSKKGMFSEEIIVVLEKAPGERRRFDYRLLATTRTRTLQKEISEAEEDGFYLFGLASRGEHIVIMESISEPE